MAESVQAKWYVLRDLKRRNAKTLGYLELKDKGFEVFTPLKWEIIEKAGKRIRKEVPIIADLLFVHSVKAELDKVVSVTSSLQYRYKLGQTMHNPTVVRDKDMERFIDAVSKSTNVRYYLPEELGPEMYGKEVRIVGGPFDGYTGRLLSQRGTKKRHLIVEIPDFIAAAIEVQPEYIEFVD